jgi:hypothetical protein
MEKKESAKWKRGRGSKLKLHRWMKGEEKEKRARKEKSARKWEMQKMNGRETKKRRRAIEKCNK